MISCKASSSSSSATPVIDGVLEGDLYAAQNSFIVKAEMTKGAGGDEH